MKMVLVGVSKREKKKTKQKTNNSKKRTADRQLMEIVKDRENVLTYDLSKSRQINKDHYFFLSCGLL